MRPSLRPIRVRGLIVAALCWGLFGVALWLHPNPSHYGTHTQLGLGACPFLMRTGLPCVTCGLTTSVSATAHLDLALAWQANPAGIVLLLGAVVLALAGSGELATGRNLLAGLRPKWWAYGLVLGLPMAWALRLAVGLASGTLPV